MDFETAVHPAYRTTHLADRPVGTVHGTLAVAVPAAMQLAMAATMMTEADVRHLAVIDETGCCAGVLSDQMLTAKWVRDPVGFADLRVGDLTQRVTVSRTSTIGTVAALMAEWGADAVAVVSDDGSAVGLVTATDLVGQIASGHRLGAAVVT